MTKDWRQAIARSKWSVPGFSLLGSSAGAADVVIATQERNDP